MAKKPPALGRGLQALLDHRPPQAPEEENAAAPQPGVFMLDIRQIAPNPHQPRQHFDDAALQELAASIRTFGVVQPLLVMEKGDFYHIIAGERRYRAARLAQLTELPVVVKELSEMDTLQVALIENIQREDLTPLEEARCYQRLMDEFFYSEEEIAQRVGKNRHAVAGALLLLLLCEQAQAYAVTGQLTASHAKALLAIDDPALQADLAQAVAEEGLSVRATEQRVATLLKEMQTPETDPGVSEAVALAYRTAEADLQRALGSQVLIRPGKKKGRIEIAYHSPNELERLLALLKQVGSGNN